MGGVFMKVKICGISNEIDALAAINLGADAIGFVMGGKVLPVEVEPYAQWVRETIKKFPKGVDSFLVTHLFDGDDILDLSNYIKSTGIQISEDIDIEEVKKVRKNISIVPPPIPVPLTIPDKIPPITETP